MTNFKNLKIAVTDNDHLKAVCDVLRSMGYRKTRNAFCEHDNYVITRSDGYYSGFITDTGFKIGHITATLSDLLKMRDEMVKHNAKSS